MPQISVIVPVWNGEAVIRRCLEALMAQTIPAEEFEIIVVDNGSSDGTAEIVRSFGRVKLLSELRPGSYAARNTALAEVTTPLVAFTDADCVPDPTWLEVGLDKARRTPGFGVLAGRIDLFEEGRSDGPAYADYERLFSFPQSEAAMGNCATANWISPTDVLRSLGGFDAAVKSGGDRQMALRVKAEGRPLVYVPEMIVSHPVRATDAELIKKRRRLSGGRWDRTTSSARLLRVLGVTGRETARRLKVAAFAQRLPLKRRLEVMRLTIRLSAVAVSEYWQLSKGRAARRD